MNNTQKLRLTRTHDRILREQRYRATYASYCKFIRENVDNGRLDEGMFDKLIPANLRKYVDFIKELASKVKLELKELLILFTNKFVFKFFTAIKWSLEKLFKAIKDGFNLYLDIFKIIGEWVAKNKVSKWTTEKLRELDLYLRTHPRLKTVGGIIVGGLLVFIWLRVGFTGHYKVDFHLDTLIDAVAGNYNLVDIFGGPNGIQIIMLIIAGALGLSFPWPGSQSIQFITALIGTLAAKLKSKIKLRVPYV